MCGRLYDRGVLYFDMCYIGGEKCIVLTFESKYIENTKKNRDKLLYIQ